MGSPVSSDIAAGHSLPRLLVTRTWSSRGRQDIDKKIPHVPRAQVGCGHLFQARPVPTLHPPLTVCGHGKKASPHLCPLIVPPYFLGFLREELRPNAV